MLISDVFLWTPSHGRANAGRPARTYIHHLCADTGCSLRICRKQCPIVRGGERGSGISMLIAWHDNDDDIGIFILLLQWALSKTDLVRIAAICWTTPPYNPNNKWNIFDSHMMLTSYGLVPDKLRLVDSYECFGTKPFGISWICGEVCKFI